MYLVLKTLSPLFSIAPMLKSLTATMLKTSRSYSRPKVSSSQRIDFLSDAIAWPHLSSSPRRTQIASDTLRPERVVNVSRTATRPPATSAKRYEGFGCGSTHFAKLRPSARSPEPDGLPFDKRTG